MRTIKFRGKYLFNDDMYPDVTWLYGGYAEIDGRGFIFPEGKFHYGYGDYWADDEIPDIPIVDKNTVGQFTGLLDKKGNEIYEGDIMYSEFSDGSGGHSLIGWNESIASFGMMDAYSYQSKQEGYDFPEFKNYVLIAHLQNAIICEVVGNIYDNPKLLSVKK